MSKKPKKLLDANTAVSSYLDNLLQEATEFKSVQSNDLHHDHDHDNVHVLETPLTTAKQLTKEGIVQVFEESFIDDKAEEVELEKAELSYKEQFEYPVQCLMFKVKEHLLAIPLIKMGSVVPFGERLNQLPYSPNYFKGLLKHRDKNVRVADTAVLLLNDIQGSDDDIFAPSHLLIFENDDWAISCDELLDVVTLEEDDIKWHSDENRLSLGTIKSSLAMILNPHTICEKLINTENLEKN